MNSEKYSVDKVFELEETIHIHDLASLPSSPNWTEEPEPAYITCCNKMRISSEGRVREMYPHVLGEYIMMKNTSGRTSYSKAGSLEMFLTQPETAELGKWYAWGVTGSPGATWGYLRSTRLPLCPARAGPWKMFDRNTKRWVLDHTLQVVCFPE